MSKKTITQNNLPSFWDRVTAYINDRLPKGALAAKDTAPIEMGGTNATTAKDARVNLGITYGTEVPTETPVTGSGAIYFFEDEYTPVSVVEGGTGANTAEGALENLGVGDWVVEQGTSGAWQYRKWANGMVDCWGKYSVVTAGGGLTAETTITLPITFKDTNYFIQYSKSSNGNSFVSNQENVHPETFGRTTTQFILRTYNSSSVTVTQEYHIYVHGTWK